MVREHIPKAFNRTERVADLIQQELSTLIRRECDEPSLRFVTIMSVTVSPDLSHAKIYITLLNDDDSQVVHTAMTTLKKSAKHLRYLLAKVIKMRVTPELKFFYDDSLKRGYELTTLINNAIAADEEQHKP